MEQTGQVPHTDHLINITMAKVPYGITGPFIGRLGNTIGYMLNGVNVIRSIGDVRGEKTPLQLANHQRMSLISSLSTAIQEFLKFGFQSVAAPGKQGPTNHSISINKEVAVKGVYPNQETDFTKLIVAQGPIPGPKDPVVKVVETQLEFQWKADLKAEGADKSDQVMLLAYFPQSKKSIILPSGARRTAEKETLEIPAFDQDTVIETYIAFVADDRMNASNSVYLGQVVIKSATDIKEMKLNAHLKAIENQPTRLEVLEEGEIPLPKPEKFDQGYSDLFHFASGYQPQTERMRILSPLLKQFKDIIEVGFAGGDKRTTARNKAVSRNINTAIGGDGIYNLYYPALIFSAGKREPAWATKLTLSPERALNVKWDVPKTAKMTVIGHDEVHFVIYNSTQNLRTGNYGDVRREDLSAQISVSADPGDILYCWMFFLSPDRKSASNSDYLGCTEML